jgi:hypothetical protein
MQVHCASNGTVPGFQSSNESVTLPPQCGQFMGNNTTFDNADSGGKDLGALLRTDG